MTEMFLVNLWILRKNSFYQNETTTPPPKKSQNYRPLVFKSNLILKSVTFSWTALLLWACFPQAIFLWTTMADLPLLRISHGGVTLIITTVSWMSFQISFLLICIHRDSPSPMQFSIPFIPKPSETLALGWKNLRLKLINYDTFSVYRIHSQHIGYQKFWY